MYDKILWKLMIKISTLTNNKRVLMSISLDP